jgi:hypothetical protein
MLPFKCEKSGQEFLPDGDCLLDIENLILNDKLSDKNRWDCKIYD